MARPGRPVGYVCSPETRARISASRRRHDRDAVLNAWAAGAAYPDIIQQTGVSKSSIGSIIEAARAAGDPRAHVRPRNSFRAAMPDHVRRHYLKLRACGLSRLVAVAECDQLFQTARPAASEAGACGGEGRASLPSSPPVSAPCVAAVHAGTMQEQPR